VVGSSAGEVVAAIDAAVEAHAAGEPQQDDVTVVALVVT
jgi:serine phosphatase RsbU (regulator of sigma subunit)